MSQVLELLMKKILIESSNKPPTHETKDLYKRFEKLCKEKDMTGCVLKEMFCENTGAHFLDSGGVYGRGYERSQAVKHLDWDQMSDVVSEVDRYSDDRYEIEITKSSYKYLCNYLTYDPEMDRKFHEFCETEENKKESYYSLMTKFIEENEYSSMFGSHNTYNGDTCLDKTLQWKSFSSDGDEYDGHIILQTHNGCDVRGGYSTPHVFECDVELLFCTIDNLSANCPNYEYSEKPIKQKLRKRILDRLKGRKCKYYHYCAYSDDCGYHWYSDGNGDNDWIYITDEEDEHKAVCPGCGAEIEFGM